MNKIFSQIVSDLDPNAVPTVAKREQLESDIEQKVCKYAKDHGMLAYKFSSPAHRSVPDRMFIYKGLVFFIEFKREGRKATPAQLQEHEVIKGQRIAVYVIDNVMDGKGLIDRYLKLVEGK